MNLKIITPEKMLFQGQVSLIQVPGKSGTFEVLKNHAPIISTLVKGKVKIKDAQEQIQFFDIDGGVIQVRHNDIVLLTEMV